MTLFTTRPKCPKRAKLRLAAVMIAGSAIFSAGSASWAGSIFDDDYTPPKRVEPAPTPAPSPPVRSESPTPAPADHPPIAPAPTPSAVTNAAQRSIPDRASRAKCRKLFEEVYGAELKDHSPDTRRKLAQTLLTEADKNAEGSPDRFVLLNGVIQAAEEGQRLSVCFDAAKRLADGYDVDELATEVEAATKAYAGRPSAELGNGENIAALGRIVEQVEANDAFGLAAPVLAVLQRALSTASDAALKAQIKNQSRDLTSYRDARERIAPAIEKLKTLPQDPAANLAVGSFLCFRRGQWASGLPLLAKSSDSNLKNIAAAELAAASGSDAKVAIADKWFAAAAKLPASDRPKALEHAADMYRNAETGLTGLQRLAVEQRLAQIPSSSRSRHVDLLKLFDPSTSIIKGGWRMENGALVCDGDQQNGRVEFAYEPPEEYDFKITFTDLHKVDTVTQICYSDGHQFCFSIGGWGNSISAFDIVDGINGSKNKTLSRRDQWFVPDRRYTSVIKVRRGGVEAYFDGQLISSLKTDYSNVSLADYWRLSHDNVVGIGMERNEVRFDTIEIIEITGEGKLLKR